MSPRCTQGHNMMSLTRQDPAAGDWLACPGRGQQRRRLPAPALVQHLQMPKCMKLN
jgi:hypothetical protein